MSLFWAAKIVLQHSTGPAPWARIASARSATNSAANAVHSSLQMQRLERFGIPGHGALLTLAPVLLEADDVGGPKPAVFAGPRMGYVFGPILLWDHKLP